MVLPALPRWQRIVSASYALQNCRLCAVPSTPLKLEIYLGGNNVRMLFKTIFQESEFDKTFTNKYNIQYFL